MFSFHRERERGIPVRVMQYRRYGPASVLEEAERDRPRAKPHQLVVRVAYSSVNPIDWKLRQGLLPFRLPLPFPMVPGYDIAGQVVEVGPRVTRFDVGDWVFACLDSRLGGAAAEYAAVGEEAAARIPPNVSVSNAALVPLAGLTALQALRDLGRLRPGHRVLVVGASGGVGHMAVQIAKATGASVTAVCGPTNVSFVRDLGADQVIDYSETNDFGVAAPYDVILDGVGDESIQRFSSWLTRRGVYVATLPTAGILVRALFLPLFSQQRVRLVLTRPRGRDLTFLGDLMERGKLRVVQESEFSLSDLPSAHRRSETGHVRGKVLVAVCPDCVPAP